MTESVYPRLHDLLLLRENLFDKDTYSFHAVSSNWPFMTHENPESTGPKLLFEPYTAKSVRKKETPIPINETLTKAASKKKCAELNATLCKTIYHEFFVEISFQILRQILN